jgi:hypothetical protein
MAEVCEWVHQASFSDKHAVITDHRRAWKHGIISAAWQGAPVVVHGWYSQQAL